MPRSIPTITLHTFLPSELGSFLLTGRCPIWHIFH